LKRWWRGGERGLSDERRRRLERARVYKARAAFVHYVGDAQHPPRFSSQAAMHCLFFLCRGAAPTHWGSSLSMAPSIVGIPRRRLPSTAAWGRSTSAECSCYAFLVVFVVVVFSASSHYKVCRAP
jgi:hypothetical protein